MSLKPIFCIVAVLAFMGRAAAVSYGADSDGDGMTRVATASENTRRGMEILDGVFEQYFTRDRRGAPILHRYYDPFTRQLSHEKGSVWMYTACIEATVSCMKALTLLRDEGFSELYDSNYSRLENRLAMLYDGLRFFEGSFELVSYTGTARWTVYAVDRSYRPSGADVTGILNVYDDQEWLSRELLEAYFLTGKQEYLAKAEYLAQYILDGWDCTIDPRSGAEWGGITWGPGYNSKHACSNGPIVSPLVWLHEIYKDKPDSVEYRRIGKNGERISSMMSKSDYYLMFARKVYDFHKNSYMCDECGCYRDMLSSRPVRNADGSVGTAYEKVGGVVYRAHNPQGRLSGKTYTYNSGTMLSGGADLYRVTGESVYLEDITTLGRNCFNHFAGDSPVGGGTRSYPISGFSVWFNDVLLRGWIESSRYADVASYVESFQANLDYAYSHFLQSRMLPVDLLSGWVNEAPAPDPASPAGPAPKAASSAPVSSDPAAPAPAADRTANSVEVLSTCAYASEYADLAIWMLGTL